MKKTLTFHGCITSSIIIFVAFWRTLHGIINTVRLRVSHLSVSASWQHTQVLPALKACYWSTVTPGITCLWHTWWDDVCLMLAEAHSAQQGVLRRRVHTDVEVLVCEIKIRDQSGLMLICHIPKSDRQVSNHKPFFFSHVSLNPHALLTCLSCTDASFACAPKHPTFASSPLTL